MTKLNKKLAISISLVVVIVSIISLTINNIFIHYKSSYLQERNIIQFSFININTTKNEIDYTLNILKQMIGDY